MAKAISIRSKPIPTVEPDSVPTCPAVARCYQAWERSQQEELAKGEHVVIASARADIAYRKAMPPLSGIKNIRDFIACTAYAMLLDILRGERGTKLLYAARIALATVPRKPRTRKTTS